MEIIPKTTKQSPLWQDMLFYFSLAAILTVMILGFFLINSLDKSVAALKDAQGKIEKAKTPEFNDLEKEILVWQKKISDFPQLLSKQPLASKAFTFINSISHPKVWFPTAKLNIEEAKFELTGRAENYVAMGQQYSILKKAPDLKSFAMSAPKIGDDGQVDFELTVYFNPEILLRK